MRDIRITRLVSHTQSESTFQTCLFRHGVSSFTCQNRKMMTSLLSRSSNLHFIQESWDATCEAEFGRRTCEGLRLQLFFPTAGEYQNSHSLRSETLLGVSAFHNHMSCAIPSKISLHHLDVEFPR
jgi:hypothetical protein